MEIGVGSVVCATAGHDLGGLFLVVGIKGEYVFLVDGKRRRVQKPKRKKQKHVTIVDVPQEENLAKGNPITNTQARKALAKYRMQFEGGFFFG